MTAEGTPDRGNITTLLSAWRGGDVGARDALFPLVYEDLRRMARRRSRQGEETLRPTVLVHEAYLRLAGGNQVSINDRQHFFALAATAMHQLVIEFARRKAAAKRGGGTPAVQLSDSDAETPANAETIISLHEALEELTELDERLARIVELRFFGGLSVEEVAGVLGVSERTVKRDWRKARAFLHSILEE